MIAASPIRDNVYDVGRRGFIFTSRKVVRHGIVPYQALIALSACGTPFKVAAGGMQGEYVALASGPMVKRSVDAMDVPLVTFHIQPVHPRYCAFRAIPAPGLWQLDRTVFNHLDAQLRAAYEGELSLDEARALFNEVVAIALAQLPAHRPADPRVNQITDLLSRNPDASLRELATEMHMSYTGMSHLFTKAVGLSLRSFRLWRKGIAAWREFESDRNLTDIAHAAGFSDSAHASRSWKKWYGLQPSYMRDAARVRVISSRSGKADRGSRI
jgi:AraC-like DNA-binding protein